MFYPEQEIEVATYISLLQNMHATHQLCALTAQMGRDKLAAIYIEIPNSHEFYFVHTQTKMNVIRIIKQCVSHVYIYSKCKFQYTKLQSIIE